MRKSNFPFPSERDKVSEESNESKTKLEKKMQNQLLNDQCYGNPIK